MKKKHLPFLFLFTILFASSTVFSQSFSCKVDKDLFDGKVNNALLTNVGEVKYIQIHVVKNDKLMYLYLKESLLNNETPITLEYKEHNYEEGITPDAELVWVPDGADRPQWHSVEGKAIVTSYNADEKTLSGTFEFIAEKASYSSRPDRKKQTALITEGFFENIRYTLMQDN